MICKWEGSRYNLWIGNPCRNSCHAFCYGQEQGVRCEVWRDKDEVVERMLMNCRVVVLGVIHIHEYVVIFFKWQMWTLTHLIANLCCALLLLVILYGNQALCGLESYKTAIHICKLTDNLRVFYCRAPSVFSVLLLLLRSSTNFKIRIHTASALSVPESREGRQHYMNDNCVLILNGVANI